MDLSERKHIERELMLVKFDADKVERKDLESMVKDFKGWIIDDSENTFTVELINNGEKLDQFIQEIDRGWIIELVRSGVSGIALGASAIKV
jgi:acetolactate synthase-1/3 small subunit